MLLIESVDPIDLPVDSDLNRRFTLLDELVNGFASVEPTIELRDQPAR